MGTVVVSETLRLVRSTLVDESGVGWSDAELIDYYNDSLRELSMVRPECYVVSEGVPLQPGLHQRMPAGTTYVFDVEFNEASGRRCTLVDRELLDKTGRYWPASTGERDVQDWAFDPRDPTVIVVSPPNDGTGRVHVTRGAVPPRVSGGTDVLPLGDHYHPVLVALIISRAYAKNTKRQDTAKSQTFRQQAYTMLGLGAQAQSAVTPRVAISEGEQ